MKNLNKVVSAAMECAAKKDIRYYLNGVALYLKGNQVVAVAANDGYTGVLMGSLEDYDETIIVDRSNKAILLHAIKEDDNEIRNEFPNIVINGIVIPQIDGRYPDIRRVIPAKNRTVSINHGIGIDPEFLVKVHKVKQSLTKGMTTRDKKSHTCRFSFGCSSETVRVDLESLDTVMIIMPVRL